MPGTDGSTSQREVCACCDDEMKKENQESQENQEIEAMGNSGSNYRDLEMGHLCCLPDSFPIIEELESYSVSESSNLRLLLALSLLSAVSLWLIYYNVSAFDGEDMNRDSATSSNIFEMSWFSRSPNPYLHR